VGRSIRLVVVVALVAALAVAACGGGGEEQPGEVVLTVSGDIGAANKGKRLELDLASLEQMRRVRLEAAEPLLKRRAMFEGVLLSDLLEVAGVPDSASKVGLTALDDDKVDFRRPTSAAPRCCWPPRPTASTCRSTGPARSGSCSPTAPPWAATRTSGSGASPRRGTDPPGLRQRQGELPATGDLRGAQVRRALLGNQLHVAGNLGGDDAAVAATVRGIHRDLRAIDTARSTRGSLTGSPGAGRTPPWPTRSSS
jgi:hypothetical protein